MSIAFLPVEFINTRQKLQRLVQSLAGVPFIAVDTEANSLYVYQERVCLIQLSVPSADLLKVEAVQDYIIDPLAIKDIRPLGQVFAAPATEVIFHGAEYDIMSLKRDFAFSFHHIFDTHLAARALGFTKVGLSSLLEQYFGLNIDKHYQQANWGKRPLPAEQLHYARMDTHYLPALRYILHTELMAKGLYEECQESFTELIHLPAHEKNFDEEGFWHIKDARQLNDQQLAVLREVYLCREAIAAKMNRPSFKVLSNSVLIDLARIMPTSQHALGKVKGVPRAVVHRFGRKLVMAIERGRNAPPPTPRRSTWIPPEVLSRYEALQNWRKEKGNARGVESDIILNRTTLWALAYQAPQTLDDLCAIRELGEHRRAKYGSEILHVLTQANQKNGFHGD